MQVFKLYFKLLKSVTPALIVYGIIFAVLTFVYSSGQEKNISSYEETKVDTAIVNYDEDSALVQDLLSYLREYCYLHYYGNDDADLADALFFREVTYILTVPYQFGEDFQSGKKVSVEKKTIPDSIYSTTVDNAINRYLNTARVYSKMMPNLSEEELISYIRNDINTETEVAIETNITKGIDYSFYYNYFNTSAYIMLACSIMGIGMIMLSFHNINIHRRNMIAPISIRDLNVQLIGGNLIFVLAFDLIFILFGIILNKEKVINANVVLFWLNTVVFSIAVLGISYLVALLVKSKGANNAISIVLSLGLSFISGAFVPQYLMGDNVLKLASFTPVYWFVRGNNAIAELSNYSLNGIKEILYYMLIQIGFAAALFALSLVVSKSRSQRFY